MDDVVGYIEQNRDRYLDELKEWLRIPSVSTDPSLKAEVDRAAQFTATQLERAGMQQVQVFTTEGHPIVYAERTEDADRPTVLVYGHYDVQPVDRSSFGIPNRSIPG